MYFDPASPGRSALWPKLILSRPLLKSLLVNPARVSDAIGLPPAVACTVRAVNLAGPWLSTQENPKSWGVTPHTVAESPPGKPTTVLQMSAAGPRSSTKNVSPP